MTLGATIFLPICVARLVRLAGTRAGGFVRTRQGAAGKWELRPIPWSASDRGIGGVGSIGRTTQSAGPLMARYGPHAP
jgi:hypothetical protein